MVRTEKSSDKNLLAVAQNVGALVWLHSPLVCFGVAWSPVAGVWHVLVTLWSPIQPLVYTYSSTEKGEGKGEREGGEGRGREEGRGRMECVHVKRGREVTSMST